MLVGTMAPDFTAQAYVGGINGRLENITLSDYRGRWVLLCFYPGDFTFVWPTELANVAVRYPELQRLGVDVLAVSVDSVYTHKIWQETELSKMVYGGVPFPMLSDRGGEISDLYGVYDEKQGVNVRGRFIIDPDGKIVAMEVLTPPVGRNIEETIRQIKAFQTVRDYGVVTPAGWQTGDATLKPSPELAGKVWTVWQPRK